MFGMLVEELPTLYFTLPYAYDLFREIAARGRATKHCQVFPSDSAGAQISEKGTNRLSMHATYEENYNLLRTCDLRRGKKYNTQHSITFTLVSPTIYPSYPPGHSGAPAFSFQNRASRILATNDTGVTQEGRASTYSSKTGVRIC